VQGRYAYTNGRRGWLLRDDFAPASVMLSTLLFALSDCLAPALTSVFPRGQDGVQSVCTKGGCEHADLCVSGQLDRAGHQEL